MTSVFDIETIRFLRELGDHNDRDWFLLQRSRYDAHVRAPAMAFSVCLEAILSARYGVDAKARIFRINRDLRFARDKTPYNTHVHMSFSDPQAQAAWMLGLEADRLVLGYGAFAFAGARLDRWRERVASPAGERLRGALDALNVRLGPPGLKRVPEPYLPNHPASDLLRRKGLAVWMTDMSVEAAFGDEAPARLARRFVALEPVRTWFIQELG